MDTAVKLAILFCTIAIQTQPRNFGVTFQPFAENKCSRNGQICLTDNFATEISGNFSRKYNLFRTTHKINFSVIDESINLAKSIARVHAQLCQIKMPKQPSRSDYIYLNRTLPWFKIESFCLSNYNNQKLPEVRNNKQKSLLLRRMQLMNIREILAGISYTHIDNKARYTSDLATVNKFRIFETVCDYANPINRISWDKLNTARQNDKFFVYTNINGQLDLCFENKNIEFHLPIFCNKAPKLTKTTSKNRAANWLIFGSSCKHMQNDLMAKLENLKTLREKMQTAIITSEQD